MGWGINLHPNSASYILSMFTVNIFCFPAIRYQDGLAHSVPCIHQALCQHSSKLFIKLITEACDPLALVTTAAKAESNKFPRRSNLLFPLLLSVTPCFQLGAYCLGTSDGA